jgi:hypothetical protein
MNPAFAPFDEAADGNKVWYLTRNRFFANAVDGGIDKSAHIFISSNAARCGSRG